jgi:hypothetical protein
VLEPHYKLVSIAHKLYQRRAIDLEIGEKIIRYTSFSKDVSSPEGPDDWERYVLGVLKVLRATDKQSWHHRIIARAAHVIYDDSNDMMVAHGAKHELTQQIFTKTMAVQVWKPENERPGRHFVYTTRYTKFFVHLLDQTGDKTSFEALARRVRRKQTDFFEHTKLWQELCMRFLNLLRRTGNVPDGHEDFVFRALNYEDYNTHAARLEAWSQDPSTQHPLLDLLRDVIDLKRLNNSLMKAVLIDDLLGDTFALLYQTIAPTLPPLPSEQTQQSLERATSITGPPTAGPPYVSSLTQVQVDGANPDPFNMFHPSQLNPQPQPPPTEPVAKTRAKTVGRREIQRRAEACAQKPAGAVTSAPASSSTTTMPIRSPPAANATLPNLHARYSPEQASAEPSAAPKNDHGNGQSGLPNNALLNPTASASSGGEQRSAPGSVHDDADGEEGMSEDESELSEVSDEELEHLGQDTFAERARLMRQEERTIADSEEDDEGKEDGDGDGDKMEE